MAEAILINKKVPLDLIYQSSKASFGDFTKAVVDIAKKIMIIGTENFVVFDSMINIRPNQGNRSRSVDDKDTRKIIIDIVNNLINAN